MATIKSYTDIEQSKKLAEILPLESADMCWSFGNIKFMDNDYDSNVVQHIPCWSLAALLNILPDCIVMNKDFQNGKYHFCSIFAETFVTADNPIDACYGFIVKYMN